MTRNFTGCTVLIYDESGKQLAATKIWEHETKENAIGIEDFPQLIPDEKYDLFILAYPSPYTCKGKVTVRGFTKYILLFKGKNSEYRKQTRYPVDYEAEITGMIYDDVPYEMLAPVKIRLVNISKGGIRFKGKYNILMTGDYFRFCMRIDNTDKLLVARVVRRVDHGKNESEYSCQLVDKHA
jgi:hypothetical protein